ncbi:Pentatricopeptide repeat-containing protein, mitochondrial, partial [Cucurbita argyrosperma subsp. argyrosperma]
MRNMKRIGNLSSVVMEAEESTNEEEEGVDVDNDGDLLLSSSWNRKFEGELRHLVRSLNPPQVEYSAIVHAYCKEGKIKKAKELVGEMFFKGCAPDVVTCTSILDREVIGKGFFPNLVEINLLAQPLRWDGQPHEAQQLLKECMSKGCAVNVVNFSTVIHGFGQKDDLEAALSLWDDMYFCNKDPGSAKLAVEDATELSMKMLRQRLAPSPVTYRPVIHQYCRKGRVEDLMKLLKNMISKGRFQTLFNLVIEKLCKFGYLKEADSLLGEGLRTASRTDAKTCHVLMESNSSVGIPMSTYTVSCQMFNRNLLPDLLLCEKVSRRLLIGGKLEEADRLVLRFVERGCVLSQDQKHLQD